MIEIKLTADTVGDMHTELLELLNGAREKPVAVPARPVDMRGFAEATIDVAAFREEAQAATGVNEAMLATADNRHTAAQSEAVIETADAPKKRGRPRKIVEEAAAPEAPEDKETGNAEPVAPAGASLETALNGAVIAENEGLSPISDGEANGASRTTTETLSADEEPPAQPLSPQAEAVTDTELQRFSARIAQHFGNPQKVFDLAGKFAPEGAVPRPTNIRDNAQRWAFIRAAEAESGLKYHG